MQAAAAKAYTAHTYILVCALLATRSTFVTNDVALEFLDDILDLKITQVHSWANSPGATRPFPEMSKQTAKENCCTLNICFRKLHHYRQIILETE